MERQLFVFDLDGTLAPVGGAIPAWAVAELAALLQWPMAQTVGVGDTDNDLPLFAVCGRSVAVGFPDAPADMHAANLREVFDLFRRLRYI